MKRLFIIAVLGVALWTQNAPAAPQKQAASSNACFLLSDTEAGAIMGGLLTEVIKSEQQASPENGRDHFTSCGYFPKGYNFERAERPPELGLELKIHAMQTIDDAGRFYENMLAMSNEMKNVPDSPLANSVITPLVNKQMKAFLVESKVEPGPGSTFAIGTIYFVKGKNFGQLQAWKKGATVTENVKSASKKIFPKLP